tara:strand:+ start:673 stop:1302 length:630 start_codon:yes stop_codon:yes gene_type:complete
MARFDPHDTDFCFARVHAENDTQKHEFTTQWLEQWLRFQTIHVGVRGAVVFDIDDTMIDHEEQPIAAVVRIYNLTKTLGLRRAIVTARPESEENRQYTIQALEMCGITEWESLYMMPDTRDVTTESVSVYKREARDDIETRHRIVANIGDMWHDLVRLPLHHANRCLESMGDAECCVFFPPMSHGEVAVKLVSRARERIIAQIKMKKGE